MLVFQQVAVYPSKNSMEQPEHTSVGFTPEALDFIKESLTSYRTNIDILIPLVEARGDQEVKTKFDLLVDSYMQFKKLTEKMQQNQASNKIDKIIQEINEAMDRMNDLTQEIEIGLGYETEETVDKSLAGETKGEDNKVNNIFMPSNPAERTNLRDTSKPKKERAQKGASETPDVITKPEIDTYVAHLPKDQEALHQGLQELIERKNELIKEGRLHGGDVSSTNSLTARKNLQDRLKIINKEIERYGLAQDIIAGLQPQFNGRNEDFEFLRKEAGLIEDKIHQGLEGKVSARKKASLESKLRSIDERVSLLLDTDVNRELKALNTRAGETSLTSVGRAYLQAGLKLSIQEIEYDLLPQLKMIEKDIRPANGQKESGPEREGVGANMGFETNTDIGEEAEQVGGRPTGGTRRGGRGPATAGQDPEVGQSDKFPASATDEKSPQTGGPKKTKTGTESQHWFNQKEVLELERRGSRAYKPEDELLSVDPDKTAKTKRGEQELPELRELKRAKFGGEATSPADPEEPTGKEKETTPIPESKQTVPEFRELRRAKFGGEVDPTTTPSSTEKEKGDGKEAGVEKEKVLTLDEAREQYIAGYKEYVASRRGPGAWVRKKLGLPLVDESKVPEELREKKEAYEAAMVRAGKAEMEKFRKVIEAGDITQEQKDALIKNHEAEVVSRGLIMGERAKLDQAKVESYPPKERGFLMRSFEWYRKQPAMLRALVGGTLSVGVGAGAVLAAPWVLTALGFAGTAAAISAGSANLGSLVGLGMFAGQRYVGAFASAALAPLAVKVGKAYETMEVARFNPFSKAFWDRNIGQERLKQRREQEQGKLFTGASLNDIKKLRAEYDKMLENHRRKDFWRQVRKIGVTTAGAAGISLLASGYLGNYVRECVAQNTLSIQTGGGMTGGAGAPGNAVVGASGGVVGGGGGPSGAPATVMGYTRPGPGWQNTISTGPGGVATPTPSAPFTPYTPTSFGRPGISGAQALQNAGFASGGEQAFEAAQGKFGGLSAAETAYTRRTPGQQLWEQAQAEAASAAKEAVLNAPQEAFIGQIPKGGNVTKTLEGMLTANRAQFGLDPSITDPKEIATWARKTAVQMLNDNPQAKMDLVHANDQVAVAWGPDGKWKVSVLERSGFKPMAHLPHHEVGSISTPDNVIAPPPTIPDQSSNFIQSGVADIVQKNFGGESWLFGKVNGMESGVWKHAQSVSARSLANASEFDYAQLGFADKNGFFRAKGFLGDIAAKTGVNPEHIPQGVSLKQYAEEAYGKYFQGFKKPSS